MFQDSGVQITTLKVDGGMTKNNLLMQHQADVLGVPVIRPRVSETTCLGAAYAAGLATGVWNDLDELKSHWRKDVEWTPSMEASVRDREYHNWRKAVEKSFGWHEDGVS
jgi:glycerol kinase